MITAQMPRIATWAAWREAARGFLAAGHAPEDIHWRFDGSDDDLFAPLEAPAAPPTRPA